MRITKREARWPYWPWEEHLQAKRAEVQPKDTGGAGIPMGDPKVVKRERRRGLLRTANRATEEHGPIVREELTVLPPDQKASSGGVQGDVFLVTYQDGTAIEFVVDRGFPGGWAMVDKQNHSGIGDNHDRDD